METNNLKIKVLLEGVAIAGQRTKDKFISGPSNLPEAILYVCPGTISISCLVPFPEVMPATLQVQSQTLQALLLLLQQVMHLTTQLQLFTQCQCEFLRQKIWYFWKSQRGPSSKSQRRSWKSERMQKCGSCLGFPSNRNGVYFILEFITQRFARLKDFDFDYISEDVDSNSNFF